MDESPWAVADPAEQAIGITLARGSVSSGADRLLDVQGRPEPPGELAGRALAPEVGEVEGRLLADHVVVQGNDVDARLAQGAEDRLDFLGRHDEVAIDDGV